MSGGSAGASPTAEGFDLRIAPFVRRKMRASRGYKFVKSSVGTGLRTLSRLKELVRFSIARQSSGQTARFENAIRLQFTRIRRALPRRKSGLPAPAGGSRFTCDFEGMVRPRQSGLLTAPRIARATSIRFSPRTMSSFRQTNVSMKGTRTVLSELKRARPHLARQPDGYQAVRFLRVIIEEAGCLSNFSGSSDNGGRICSR